MLVTSRAGWKPALRSRTRWSPSVPTSICHSHPFFYFFILSSPVCSPQPLTLRALHRRILFPATPLPPPPSSIATPSLPTLLLPYCSSSSTSPLPPPPHLLGTLTSHAASSSTAAPLPLPSSATLLLRDRR
jgi:hypothetical protein